MKRSEPSFASLVKEEITTANFSSEHLRAVLASFIKINGSISFSKNSSSLVMKTENAKVAKFIYQAINDIYGIPSRFSFTKMMNFRRRTTYNIIIDTEAEYILGDLAINFLDGKISKNIVNNDDMIAGYLCGAFLASGSVNSPTSSNYHLEIALNDENFAKWFTKLFTKYKSGEFDAKIVKRRNEFISYLKKADQITDFLIMIGATSSALQFEDVRIAREYSNIGNRLTNLDTANCKKTNEAAKEQLKDIRAIDKRITLDRIPNAKMRALAKLRLENEDASLSELATLLSEKLESPVSRSNVAHMFKAIHKFAIQIKGRDKNEL